MASIEQDLMVMLQHLPIPITITWQSNRYHWQCVDGHGSSTDLVEATGQGLNYLIASLKTDSSRLTENKSGSTVQKSKSITLQSVGIVLRSLHDIHATNYPWLQTRYVGQPLKARPVPQHGVQGHHVSGVEDVLDNLMTFSQPSTNKGSIWELSGS